MNGEAEPLDDIDTPEQPAVSAGILLREAREAAGLSVAEVAKQLKLKRSVIEALERDDYKALPSALFARGYLKSYAKLMGIPESDVMVTIDQLGLSEEVPVPHGAILTSRSRRRSEHLVLKWGSAAVVLVLIGLLVVWFQGLSTTELMSKLGIELTSESETAAVTPALPLPPIEQGEEVADEGAEALAEGPASSPPGNGGPQVQPEEQTAEPISGARPAAEVPPVEPAPDVAETAPATSPSEVLPPASEGPVAGAAVAEIPAEAPAETASASPESTGQNEASDTGGESLPLDTLELTLQADSWTEVTDASGAKLVYRLLRAGEVHRVTGHAPFTVFLGNAPGVEVRFNDEPVTDIRANRKGVASFTLGNS
ncbi:MAG: cytoskeleton protein RodZ [Gammaproteobacteria bacterium]